jgi:hypothetical protein
MRGWMTVDDGVCFVWLWGKPCGYAGGQEHSCGLSVGITGNDMSQLLSSVLVQTVVPAASETPGHAETAGCCTTSAAPHVAVSWPPP